MSHHDPIVLVLGAGFSSGAGHPVMSQFAGVVQRLATNPNSPLTDEERARFASVMDYRWKMHRLYAYLNLDLDNLEHLFSLIDMEASLATDDVPEPHALRDDLIFVLVRTLELTLKKNEAIELRARPHVLARDVGRVRNERRAAGHYTQRYRSLTQRLRPHDTVLTFNYDTLLEDALLVDGIGPNYGFAPPPWESTERTLPVLKLHGSSNFVVQENGEIAVVDHELVDRTTEHYYRRGRPFLIPPTWNKSLLHPIMQQVWKLADQALRHAASIIFIGYSLPETDLSFRYLLADALADNPSLRRISVLDPADETISRYESFISGAFMRQGRFSKYALRIEDGIPSGLGTW